MEKQEPNIALLMNFQEASDSVLLETVCWRFTLIHPLYKLTSAAPLQDRTASSSSVVGFGLDVSAILEFFLS